MLLLFWNKAIADVGFCSTQQAGQQSLASGTVVEPIVIVVGGGGGGAGGGLWRGRLVPHFTTKIPAIAGTVSTMQARQVSLATGDMVDTELEMFAAILMAAD
jgi:hypothetical protein